MHIPLIISQKNKRDFLVFVIMGGLTSFIGGSTAVQSNGLKQLFLATPPMRFNVSIIKHLLFLLIGIWRSNPHIHPSDSLIQHVLIEHPGAAVFLFFDLLIFIATMTLTISQAYMVRNSHPQSKEFTLSSLGKDCNNSCCCCCCLVHADSSEYYNERIVEHEKIQLFAGS